MRICAAPIPHLSRGTTERDSRGKTDKDAGQYCVHHAWTGEFQDVVKI